MIAMPGPAAWDLLPAEWRPLCSELGLPAYRADQIVTGLYQTLAPSWDALTTLPQPLRETLAQRVPLQPPVLRHLDAAPDGVRKLLLACADGACVETVLIPSKNRMTLCLSTQIGCAFRCAFCASGAQGRIRDLSAAEIVAQVMAACRLLREGDPAPAPRAVSVSQAAALPRPGNIVVMGMGEPFDNYDQTLRALRILNAQKGLNIGARHITISTCGVVPGIQRLAGEGTQFELSISLHAPNDRLRRQIMPVNTRWPLAELLETCRAYHATTRRVVTFEYTLIQGFNDQPDQARELVRLLRRLPCKVNLIPLSPVEGFAGNPPEHRACLAFLDILLKAKIPSTLRQSRGRDVNAACGQLRLRQAAGHDTASA